MSGYIGASPVPQATQHREAFTATASQTSFPTAGYTPQFVDVYLNGVKLAAADYTATNGSDIVLTTGAALNDILEIVAYTPFEVADQTFTGTTTTDVLVATGNVGIGTASPSAQLELSSATDYSGLKVSGTNHKLIAIETSTSNRQVLTSYKSGSHEYSIGLGTSDEFSFYDNTSAAERMRIDSSGHVIIPAGVTLGTAAGVYSAANTLDDYEEGTWTPTLVSGGSVAPLTAYYTKIGQLVTCSCYAAFSPTNNTSGLEIGGLPFTKIASIYYGSGHSIAYSGGLNTANWGASLIGGNNAIYFHKLDSGGPQVLNNAFADGQHPLMFSIAYITA